MVVVGTVSMFKGSWGFSHCWFFILLFQYYMACIKKGKEKGTNKTEGNLFIFLGSERVFWKKGERCYMLCYILCYIL